jgi:dipeptidyl aminopeptidase/acylaminoacyl peptidase
VAYFNRDARTLGFSDGRAALAGEFQHPDWTPDRRRMIYHRDLGGDWPPFRAVHSREASIHLFRSGVYPNYAPDGIRMTMNSGRNGIAHNAILLMQADGTQRTTLFDDPVRSALAPVWSPHGDRIAFGLGRFFPMVVPKAQGPVTGDLALLDVASRNLSVLTDGTGQRRFSELGTGWRTHRVPGVAGRCVRIAHHRHSDETSDSAARQLRPSELSFMVAGRRSRAVHERPRWRRQL